MERSKAGHISNGPISNWVRSFHSYPSGQGHTFARACRVMNWKHGQPSKADRAPSPRPAEVATVVAAFEQSGLSRTEYCRQHGLSLSTLNRHRQGTSEGRRITPRLVSQALPAVAPLPMAARPTAEPSPSSPTSTSATSSARSTTSAPFLSSPSPWPAYST
jgi:hypothetical protein